ncbi:MAG: 4'-phosphopantetheinyl transferase superfamily protein [Acidobacteriota bacterium]
MTAFILDRFVDSAGPENRPGPGEIHVWAVDLAPTNEALDALWRLLSSDETTRAQRFRFEVHRRRYAVRRGALRWLLGSYLGRDPSGLRFIYGDKGKPELAPGQDPVTDPARLLRFNLSDSEDLALCAVGVGQDLGVDVEVIRDMPDAESIAGHFFAEEEQRALGELPADSKALGFFNCWTRKEAYLKAIGEGLAAPLDGFSVTLRPDDPVAFQRFVHDPREAAHWNLVHLEPDRSSVGALAIRRHGDTLSGFRWRPQLRGRGV